MVVKGQKTNQTPHRTGEDPTPPTPSDHPHVEGVVGLWDPSRVHGRERKSGFPVDHPGGESSPDHVPRVPYRKQDYPRPPALELRRKTKRVHFLFVGRAPPTLLRAEAHLRPCVSLKEASHPRRRRYTVGGVKKEEGDRVRE